MEWGCEQILVTSKTGVVAVAEAAVDHFFFARGTV